MSCPEFLLTVTQMKPYHWSIQNTADIIAKWLDMTAQKPTSLGKLSISDKSTFLWNLVKTSKCAMAKKQIARKSLKWTLDTEKIKCKDLRGTETEAVSFACL